MPRKQAHDMTSWSFLWQPQTKGADSPSSLCRLAVTHSPEHEMIETATSTTTKRRRPLVQPWWHISGATAIEYTASAHRLVMAAVILSPRRFILQKDISSAEGVKFPRKAPSLSTGVSASAATCTRTCGVTSARTI